MNEWEEVTISEVVEINNYPSLEKGKIHTHVGMSDLGRYERKIQNTNLKKYKYSGTRFKNGDTLVGKMVHSLRTGKMAYVDVLDEKEVAFGSTEFLVMRPKDERIIPKYVYYTMRRRRVVKTAINWTNGTTANRERVPTSLFDKLTIRLPPIDEQKKIVALLDVLDSKIELNRAISETLEEIVDAIYTSWFVDYEPYTSKERPSNHQPVSTLGEFINGYAFSQNKITDIGRPIIKIRELKSGVSHNSDYYPEKENVDKKYHLSAGDVLFSWSASLDVFLWKKNWGLLNQHIYKVRPSTDFSRSFVYFSLKQALAELKNRADGTTTIHINRSDLDEVSVECLTPKMRERFTETARPILNEIIQLGQENESLVEARDYLLPQLLSGDIAVDYNKLDELDINIGS